MEVIIFWVLAILIIASSMLVITSRNPIYSAVALVCSFFMMAGVYALLSAHFLAVIQIMVYAGAIMVLFIFAIMLLDLKEEEKVKVRMSWTKVLGSIAAAGIMLTMVGLFLAEKTPFPSIVPFTEAQDKSFGTINTIGVEMFTQYLLPFEVASILLLVGIIGAVVIAKKQRNN